MVLDVILYLAEIEIHRHCHISFLFSISLAHIISSCQGLPSRAGGEA